MQIRWREDLTIWFGAAAFYLALGAYITLVRQYLPYDSLARLVSAWLVFSGTEVKLASIGFVWPPIPTLVILPLTLFSSLVDSWMAVVIISAAFMALACVGVNHLAALCGLPKGWRWLTVLLFAVNPLILIFGINGMSEAVLIAITLLGFYSLVRFWQTDRNTYMILAGGLFGLLPLIRYEFALLSAYSGLVMFVLCWRRRASFSEAEFRDFLEGRLLAYSSLAIYPVFLWAVSNWFVMGSPLYFLVNDRSAISLAEMQITGYIDLVTIPFYSFRLVFGTWAAAFIVGLIASVVLIVIGVRQRSSFLFVMGLMPWVMPVLQFILLSQRANVPLFRYYVMAVPLGLVAALLAVDRLQPMIAAHRNRRQLLFGGFVLLFMLSNGGTWLVMQRYPYQNIEHETWKALTTNEPLENRNFNEAYRIGQLLPSIIPTGSRILIDTYEFGYAIILGSGTHDLFMDFTDPNYEAALQNPSAYVDYVIVPRAQERGMYYSINREFKRLHAEGASWAELVDVLPVSNLDWKLYKVLR